jgi:hypothetical protein
MKCFPKELRQTIYPTISLPVNCCLSLFLRYLFHGTLRQFTTDIIPYYMKSWRRKRLRNFLFVSHIQRAMSVNLVQDPPRCPMTLIGQAIRLKFPRRGNYQVYCHLDVREHKGSCTITIKRTRRRHVPAPVRCRIRLSFL